MPENGTPHTLNQRTQAQITSHTTTQTSPSAIHPTADTTHTPEKHDHSPTE
jgi:hypothetical protein